MQLYLKAANRDMTKHQKLGNKDLTSASDDSYPEATNSLNLSLDNLDTTSFLDLIPEDSTNRSNYTKHQKMLAITHYFSTRSLRRTEALSGVPRATIGLWKNGQEWWAIIWKLFLAYKNDELDGQYTDIIDKSTVAMKDRIENGDEKMTKDGTIKRVQVPLRDLAVSMGIAYDKRALGRGEATARTDHTNENDRLKRLEKQFKKISRNEHVIEGELIENA